MKPEFFDRSELTRRLWQFRREFLWVGVFSFFANVLMLTPTVYMLQVYDRVFKSQNELTLLFVTIVMVLFFGVMAFAEWLRSRLLVRAGIRLDEGLSSLVFNASFDAYLKRAGSNPASPLSDLAMLRQFFTGSGIISFFDIPWTPIYIGVTFLLHPYLGVLSIVFAAVQLLITFRSHRLTVREIEKASNEGLESDQFLQGKLRNIEPVHAMGMIANLRQRWHEHYDKALALQALSHEQQSRQQAFVKFVRYSMQSLTLGAGALLVIDGRMSPGGMIAANVLMARALTPLDLVVATWKQFIQSRMAFERLEKLLDDHPERAPGSVFPEPKGELRLEGLSALVEGRPTPVLNSLDATFPAGKVIVVLGPSGSGKSTLARCLVGVWPETEGRVLLDGVSIDSWDRLALGRHIGYLPQDIELFDGTIADNIARFAPVDSGKVVEAAMKTGIHEMILRLPRGYDTEIGEAGSMLSGGQRQRIGLARALYDNPAVVVLDEPNANLDDAGDRSLASAVGELREKGKTVFLISHRMNVVTIADMILVLRNGNIVNYGLSQDVLAAIRPQQVPLRPSAPLTQP